MSGGRPGGRAGRWVAEWAGRAVRVMQRGADRLGGMGGAGRVGGPARRPVVQASSLFSNQSINALQFQKC
jgi:hypothetical protein